MNIINKNPKKISLTFQFLGYTFLNPVSVLILIVGGFFVSPGTFIQLLDNFFPKFGIAWIIEAYIWMAVIFSVTIFLNYFLFPIKKYNEKIQKLPIKDFLKIYFKSQEVYWVWSVFMVIPAIAIASVISIMGDSSISIVLIFFVYPFHPIYFKIAYLIFGCSLMILSHRTYVKLARGEKVKNSY